MDIRSVTFDQYEFQFPNVTDQQSDAIDFWIHQLAQSGRRIYVTDAVEFSRWLNGRGIAFRFNVKEKGSFLKRIWTRPFIRDIRFYKRLTDEQIQARQIAEQRKAQKGESL